MKTVFILRHAKSSWDQPDLSDFERPLNKRGNKAAPRIGKEMAVRGYRPELIISSPAKRAKQTTALVTEAAGFDVEIRFDRSIYEAGITSLFYVLSEIPDSCQSAMLVGHNPGFEQLVEILISRYKRMPTAALAVVEIDTEVWSDTAEGSGTLVDLLLPRELS